jgi:hypothetical protein
MEGIVLMIWNTKWMVFTVYSNMMKCRDIDCFTGMMVGEMVDFVGVDESCVHERESIKWGMVRSLFVHL